MTPRTENAKLISSQRMRSLEINAEYFGVSPLQLMENAGSKIACEVASRFPIDKRIAIFCGLGGNGGDGFVAARHLSAMGFGVTVLLSGKDKDITHEAAARNWDALQFLRDIIQIYTITDSSAIPEVGADVVIDALLGTGTKGILKPPIFQLVEHINSLHAFKIAVDAPTGIDSDTGEVLGSAVKANLTITFHMVKTGLLSSKKYVGEIIVENIGLPIELETYAGPGDVLIAVRKRPTTSHKGDFGRLLVVGGSEVFSGAPTLVSLAALRTGVDIVYLAAPAKTAQAISSLSPDLITLKLDGNHLKPRNIDELQPYIREVDAVALGPGLGMHPETRDFAKACIVNVEAAGKPLLIDADGLKAFAEFKRPLKIPFVLTPHAREFEILAGSKLPEKFKDKVITVQNMAAELNGVVLLKGKVDIICSAKRLKLNFTGNPGMTVGGTGDVLSGIVGALLAQNVDAFEAAVAGAFTNGAAGDFMANEIGYHMVASDLLKWIPQVLNSPMSHLKVRKTNGSFA